MKFRMKQERVCVCVCVCVCVIVGGVIVGGVTVLGYTPSHRRVDGTDRGTTLWTESDQDTG